VRALAVASDQRNASLPEVPTAAEGGVRGFEVNSWNAVSVKAGTPPAIVARLSREFAAAIASPVVGRKLRDMNSEPWPLTPEQTRQLMATEIARWKGVIERARINRN
jgi:tripartite-type tricarboxylate transporter receptor subunit TctC